MYFIARVGILFWEGNLAFLVKWGEDLLLKCTLVRPGLSIFLITFSFSFFVCVAQLRLLIVSVWNVGWLGCVFGVG